MAKLTKAQRAAAPKGLPSRGSATGSFPMPDANHARLAKAMASRSKNVGNISAAQEAEINARANAILNAGKVRTPR